MSDDLERFERWRRRIPWNNAQIEIALREEAATQPNEYMRNRYLSMADHLAASGRFTQRMLSTVLGRLTKVCAICGKKALYRITYSGRCLEHRLIGRQAEMARMEAVQAAFAEVYDDREHRLRIQDAQQSRRSYDRVGLRRQG